MAKRFQDLRIAAKLAIGFGAVLVLTAMCAIFVFVQTQRQIGIARHSAVMFRAVDLVDLLAGDLDASRAAMRKLVVTGSRADHQQFEAEYADHGRHIAQLSELLAGSAPEYLALVADYKKAADLYAQRSLRRNAELAVDPATRAQAEDAVRSPEATPLIKAVDARLDKLRQQIDARSDTLQAEAETAAAHTQWTNATCGVLALLLGVCMALLIARAVAQPIGEVTSTIRALAHGDLGVAVPARERGDEIGEMARGVQVLKDAALEKRRIEEGAEAARRASQEELERNAATRAADAAQQARVVERLAGALNDLAAGNLVQRLDDPFAADYETLRADFNAAVTQLQTTMQEVNAATGIIRSGAGEISSASDDLSRRTEQQAASLEETAAALAEITEDARKTAAGALHAREVVGTASGNAARSREVISRTVVAMREIERSSRQVREILGVIDEIAFQTNLLALNAGVEAARAGESGRGFAVVASEVRGLAQRCAEAAKEIKTLIVASETQVRSGVDLVAETGVCVGQIVEGVGEMNKVVEDIAGAAERQAVGLAEVNRAIDQMDQVTQKNAAMVEEATAATHGLAKESDDLVRLVGHFRVGAAAAPLPPAAVASFTPKPAPRRAPAAVPAPVRANVSPAARLQDQVAVAVNDWTEF